MYAGLIKIPCYPHLSLAGEDTPPPSARSACVSWRIEIVQFLVQTRSVASFQVLCYLREVKAGCPGAGSTAITDYASDDYPNFSACVYFDY